MQRARQFRANGGLGGLVPLRNIAPGHRRIRVHHGFQPQLADGAATLHERLRVRIDLADMLQRGAFDAEQMVLDAKQIFADDVHIGIGQQIMDFRDAPGLRVFDGNHPHRRIAARHRFEHVFELRYGHRLHVRILRSADKIGIGAGNPGEGDGMNGVFWAGHQAACSLHIECFRAIRGVITEIKPDNHFCHSRARRVQRDALDLSLCRESSQNNVWLYSRHSLPPPWRSKYDDNMK